MNEGTNMTTVSFRPAWDVSCSRCGAFSSFATEDEAATYARKHERTHEVQRERGRELEGRVYDLDALDVPWAGPITTAIKHAQAAGYGYLVWNGRVFETTGYDFNNPVCRADDVPGTTEYERKNR
jgi:phage FluMu protein Com